jgi:hypothetical protein
MDGTGSCHAEASVVLRLAPEEAWNVVMDWERQSRWMLFTRVWATENDGTGVGGGVAARTSVGGIGFTDDMVITHWDPPRECTVKHLGTVVRGTGTFTITPTTATSADTSSPGPTSSPSAPSADTQCPDPTGATGAGSAAGGAACGSRFTWAEDVVPPLGRVGVVGWVVVRPVFEAMMRRSLRRLVREVHA